MPILYYLINLVITSLFLLPATTSIFYHLPLSKKLIRARLINDVNKLQKINRLRITIFLSIYIIFISLSLFFIGTGALVSTLVNLVLCIIVERNKILGKDTTVQQSYIDSFSKFFIDQNQISEYILNKTMKSEDDRLSDELWTERIMSGDIEKWDAKNEYVFAVIDSLRKSSTESEERDIRWNKIYEIEKAKWPDGLKNFKSRDELSENLQSELDLYITKSQDIARQACQTVELTNKYLKENLIVKN